MAELTYKNACIIYLEKNMECVGYRDYIIKQLKRLEQIEKIVNNCDCSVADTVVRFTMINGVLEE